MASKTRRKPGSATVYDLYSIREEIGTVSLLGDFFFFWLKRRDHRIEETDADLFALICFVFDCREVILEFTVQLIERRKRMWLSR